ncbi:MAG: PQQ-dependent sugar dehydrogenase [Deltaproteobacteria bacterium]|nr:PQQ-dependent sugar dehydrogenase [Deltaproteobacteria bacterium]
MKALSAALLAALLGGCTRARPVASRPALPRSSERLGATAPPTTALVALPEPFATPSAQRPAVLVPRPAGASLRPAQGFTVRPWARGLLGARHLARSPDGRLFATDSRRGRLLLVEPGSAEPTVFASGLGLPFGVAFLPEAWVLVACTDAVVRLRYRPGQRAADGPAERVVTLPGHGYHQHWTRTLALSTDHGTLFVSVGSETDADVEPDPRRGAVSACDVSSWRCRVFAGGLRNAVGMALEPARGALFAAVNERDGLGDDLPPDYLTEVREGAFYGWPYAYFGPHPDPRHGGERPDLVASTVTPDLSLGAHSAPVAVLFPTEGPLRGDAVVSLHGSWNRAQLVGYKVVRVRLQGGRPTGAVEDLLTGWLLPDGRAWGRPAGLAALPGGALLVLDDGTGEVWALEAVTAP